MGEFDQFKECRNVTETKKISSSLDIYALNQRVYQDRSWCIYQIFFATSRKIYIGSTIHWANRVRSHFYDLRHNRHCNRMLQFSFNKHAKNGVWIRQIEKIDPAKGGDYLLSREEFWIKCCRTFDPKYGFNVVGNPTDKMAFCKQLTPEQIKARKDALKRYWSDPALTEQRAESRKRALEKTMENSRKFILYSPAGERFEFTNLSKFCRERELPFNKIYAVATDAAIEYKGWKSNPNRRNKVEKPFRIKNSEGQIFEGTNLTKFCIERNLNPDPMYLMTSGYLKKSQGWSLASSSEEFLRDKSIGTFTLQHKDGRAVTITNLSKWCREHPDKPNQGNLSMNFRSKGWIIIKRHE